MQKKYFNKGNRICKRSNSTIYINLNHSASKIGNLEMCITFLIEMKLNIIDRLGQVFQTSFDDHETTVVTTQNKLQYLGY